MASESRMPLSRILLKHLELKKFRNITLFGTVPWALPPNTFSGKVVSITHSSNWSTQRSCVVTTAFEEDLPTAINPIKKTPPTVVVWIGTAPLGLYI